MKSRLGSVGSEQAWYSGMKSSDFCLCLLCMMTTVLSLDFPKLCQYNNSLHATQFQGYRTSRSFGAQGYPNAVRYIVFYVNNTTSSHHHTRHIILLLFPRQISHRCRVDHLDGDVCGTAWIIPHPFKQISQAMAFMDTSTSSSTSAAPKMTKICSR